MVRVCRSHAFIRRTLAEAAGASGVSCCEQFRQATRSVFVFLGAWGAGDTCCFLSCIPAVSFTQTRLNLSYWGPLFLLFATATAIGAYKQVPVPPALAVSDLAILVFVSTIRSEEEYAITGGWSDGTTSACERMNRAYSDRLRPAELEPFNLTFWRVAAWPAAWRRVRFV